MRQSKLLATQLQKRDPNAWTALLREQVGKDDLVVTAVSAKPITPHKKSSRHATRFLLSLAGHSDPISFTGQHIDPTEAIFYREFAPRLPDLAPRCHFLHQATSHASGWAVLDDIPNDILPEKWAATDVSAILDKLAHMHGLFWDQFAELTSAGLTASLERKGVSWETLIAEQKIYFDEGPGAILSEHALTQAGQLATQFLQAANGLVVLRDLGGWPGILGETQLTAVADLLDDPVPMLEPLRQLPQTLLHGDPNNSNWRLTVFEDQHLTGWQTAVVGSAICDLVSFIEQFALLENSEQNGMMKTRPLWPINEETMIDTYMLALSHRLGARLNTRALRQAIPAARCLYVLTKWFPHFATWFEAMPNKFTWQKINRMSDSDLADTPLHGFMQLRPYLSGVFERFLLAYRSL
ncbi:MAG: phosphotransferase [Chloroflexi bacterium]|nr:phosphotransferase [Chloroflexota bacterium]